MQLKVRHTTLYFNLIILKFWFDVPWKLELVKVYPWNTSSIKALSSEMIFSFAYYIILLCYYTYNGLFCAVYFNMISLSFHTSSGKWWIYRMKNSWLLWLKICRLRAEDSGHQSYDPQSDAVIDPQISTLLISVTEVSFVRFGVLIIYSFTQVFRTKCTGIWHFNQT